MSRGKAVLTLYCGQQGCGSTVARVRVDGDGQIWFTPSVSPGYPVGHEPGTPQAMLLHESEGLWVLDRHARQYVECPSPTHGPAPLMVVVGELAVAVEEARATRPRKAVVRPLSKTEAQAVATLYVRPELDAERTVIAISGTVVLSR